MLLLNIIMLSFLVNFIRRIFFKEQFNTLSCGIFAFMSDSPNKFNVDKFNILGIINDERGRDSSGRLIDNTLDISSKLYKDLAAKEKLVRPKECSVVLGHTRTGSWNSPKTLDYAQPFILYNEEGTQIDFSIVHNGTIFNTEELARKYDISDYDEDGQKMNLNDTQVLGYALSEEKFDILKDYEGTAVLIWHDRIKNLVYVYKGASIENSYSNKISEERPLFYWEHNGSTYFSSIKLSLEIIANGQGEINSVNPNILYIYKNGKFENSILVDRNKSYQSSYVKNTYRNYSPSNPFVSNKTYVPGQRDLPSLPAKKIDNNSNAYEKFANERILAESDKSYPKIVWAGGRYYYKGKLVNGIYSISEMGYLFNSPNRSYTTKVYYFIDGILFLDHDSFQQVCSWKAYILGKRKHMPERTKFSDFYSIYNNKPTDLLLNALYSFYSAYPVHILGEESVGNAMLWIPNKKKYYNGVTSMADLFHSGLISPMWNNKIYEYVSGKIVDITILDNYILPKHEVNLDIQPSESFYEETNESDNEEELDNLIDEDDDIAEGMLSEQDEYEKAWMEDATIEDYKRQFSKFIDLCTDIENAVFATEDLKCSKKAQSLVDDIRNLISTSTFV